MDINTMNQGEQNMIKTTKKRTLIAVAAAIAMTGAMTIPAHALVMGSVKVNSALGEPLKAEVPINQIDSGDIETLEVSIASPQDYGANGLTYNSILATVRLNFEARGKDRGVIIVTSSRLVQEPFIDLLVNVKWGSGSTQRNYTMLIDPPGSMMQAIPTVNIGASQQGGSTSGLTSAGTQVSIMREQGGKGWKVNPEQLNTTGQATTVQPSTPQTTAGSTVAGNTTAPTKQPATTVSTPPAYGDGYHLTIQRGQTLSKIARSFKPAGVTTEQMLAALYKANPNAFINNNINWIKAGATLIIPSDQEIAAVDLKEARGLVSSHARQFNQQRRAIADNATTVSNTDTSGRPQTGKVEQVQLEKTVETGDVVDVKLTVDPEMAEREAAQHQARITAERTQEIDANIEETQEIIREIEKIKAESAASESIEADGNPEVVVEGDETELVDDSEEQETTDPLVVTEESVESPAVETSTQTATDNQVTYTDYNDQAPLKKDLMDHVMDNLLFIVAGVLALLAALLFIIKRKRRNNDAHFDDFEEDDEFDGEEDDSFFANPSAQDSFMLDQSSSIYAASQLDTSIDVDPVQEADVYLAYGRDEQAAEILKDALITEPNRVSLHAKLTEVYARQNDVVAFNQQAAELRSLTGGRGAEWDRILRLAQNLDPHNPLYAEGADTQSRRHDDFPETAPVADDYAYSEAAAQQSSVGAVDSLDMDDLDLSLDVGDTRAMEALDSDPYSLDEEEEGPTTRLALAEEFFAIGNKQDAREIAAEILSQENSAEVRRRAQALLERTSQ